MLKMPLLLILLFCICSTHCEEIGILEKSVTSGMRMIDSEKFQEAMNEIRVGINCFKYDQRKISLDVVKNLDAKIDQEAKPERKAAFLVYKAVIMLSGIKENTDAADQALKELNLAAISNPKLPEVYNTRGICFLIKKDFSNAIVDFDKAISLNSNYLDAIRNRSDALWALGKQEKSLEDKIRYQRLLSKLYYAPEKN